jgi:GT2 family glycosyltransferase
MAAIIDLSVVIVNWNTAELLVHCLESLRPAAKRHSMEIIVVDNASTDGSVDAVKKGFPDVKLIQSDTNLGFAKGNNLGISEAAGRYICLINSDVVASEGCLDQMCDYMDRHVSIGILGPKVLNADLTLQPSCRQFPTVWNTFCRALALDVLLPKSRLLGGFYMTFSRGDQVAQVDVLSGCFWMARRVAMDQIGLLDEGFFMYAEDVDYCKRSRLSGWDNVYFPEVQIVHFNGSSSARAPVRFLMENLKATQRYLGKYHGPVERALFLLAIFVLHARRSLSAAVRCLLPSGEKQRSLTEMKANAACALWLLRMSSARISGTS